MGRVQLGWAFVIVVPMNQQEFIHFLNNLNATVNSILVWISRDKIS